MIVHDRRVSLQGTQAYTSHLSDMRLLLLSRTVLFTLSLGWAAQAESRPEPYPTCEGQPSESQVTGAKGAYKAGHVSFDEGDYERAILYWEDAFRRDCTANKLLLNLARAYELAAKKRHALLALETFLERDPSSEERSVIERRITTLRAQIKSAGDAASPTTSAHPSSETSHEETAPPLEPPARKKPAWPVVLTAAGAATAGVGLGLFLTGQLTLDGAACSTNEDGDVACSANPSAGTTTGHDEAARAASAQNLRNVGGGVAIAGGALLALGKAS